MRVGLLGRGGGAGGQSGGRRARRERGERGEQRCWTGTVHCGLSFVAVARTAGRVSDAVADPAADVLSGRPAADVPSGPQVYRPGKPWSPAGTGL
ncbi:hypothetical protein Sm713_25540 [Streptomyces sp. TS71-3]|nr:hypothetical protein Sm713_25540 [Streptomyces sp. TS71-3]